MRANPYETRRYLHEYLLLHYGRPRDVCPFLIVPADWLRFHQRLRREYLLPVCSRAGSRGLDIGCAVGRFTFELGRVVNEVIGIDTSKAFIKTARQMVKRHSLQMYVHETGSEFSVRRLVLPKALQRSRVEFKVGDAMNLSSFRDQAFQVVSAINLIDRLPRPRQFLQQVARLVAPGGLLLLASPLTWLEQYTAPREWLTRQQVEALLRPYFRPSRDGNLPFLIREHRRKYQLVVAKVWTFIRRPHDM